MKAREMKRCPFCNGIARISASKKGDTVVVMGKCNACDAESTSVLFHSDYHDIEGREDLAIKYWNRRGGNFNERL